MKKFLKKLVSFILVVLLIVVIISAVFVACGASGKKVRLPSALSWIADLPWFGWFPFKIFEIQKPAPEPEHVPGVVEPEPEDPDLPSIEGYTVWFYSEGELYVSVPVEKDTALNDKFPAAPERFEYTFNGWTANGEAFTKDTVVTSNTRVDAEWEALGHDYEFVRSYVDENGHTCWQWKCRNADCDGERIVVEHEYVYAETLEEKFNGHTQELYKCNHCQEEHKKYIHVFGEDGKCTVSYTTEDGTVRICGVKSLDCEHEYENGICVKCGIYKFTLTKPDSGDTGDTGGTGTGTGGDNTGDTGEGGDNTGGTGGTGGGTGGSGETGEGGDNTGDGTGGTGENTGSGDGTGGTGNTGTGGDNTGDTGDNTGSGGNEGDHAYWESTVDSSSMVPVGFCLCGDCDAGCDCYILGYCRFGKCDCSDTDIPEDKASEAFITRSVYADEGGNIYRSPNGDPSRFKIAFTFDTVDMKEHKFHVEGAGENEYRIVAEVPFELLVHKVTLVEYGLENYFPVPDGEKLSMFRLVTTAEKNYVTVQIVFPDEISTERFWGSYYEDIQLVVRVFAKPATEPNVEVYAIDNDGNETATELVSFDFVKFYPDGSTLYCVTAAKDYRIRRIEGNDIYYTYGAQSAGYAKYCKFPSAGENAYGVFGCKVFLEPISVGEFQYDESRVQVSEIPAWIEYTFVDNGNGTYTFMYNVNRMFNNHSVKDFAFEGYGFNVVYKQLGTDWGYLTFTVDENYYDPDRGFYGEMRIVFLEQ